MKDEFIYAVQKAESYSLAIDRRKAGLRILIERRNAQGVGKRDLAFEINAEFAKDGELKDLETMRQRAEQTAIMYGIGAILEKL